MCYFSFACSSRVVPLTDRELVALLLGREPLGEFDVVVRRDDSSPVVIANQPLLGTGRPMPTRFWLADRALNKAIGQLESTGAVNRAEREIPADQIAATHAAAATERDLLIAPDHQGPRPSGGVGGTRMGVKCLHAHYASFLAGADDVVGRWVQEQLIGSGQQYDPTRSGIVTELARKGSGSVENSATSVKPRNPEQSVAIIDLGSASTRLLIRPTSQGTTSQGAASLPTVTDLRRQIVTRMGEGISQGGVISQASLHRVEEALLEYHGLCQEAQVSLIVVVTTATARRASNTDDLAALVRRIFDCELRILSESEEGQMAFLGATSQVAKDSLVMVIDIGGSSTEFVVGVTGPDGGETRVVSAPIGAVSITEEFLSSNPPDPAELSSALSFISSHVDDVIRELPGVLNATTSGTIIGVGGTTTTTAGVEIGLLRYRSDLVNGFRLKREAVEDVFRTLATESHVDRAYNPGLEEDRVTLIVGGLCILVAIMRRLAIDEIIVSDNDLLEGMVAQVRAR